jgi:hypothetical protein
MFLDFFMMLSWVLYAIADDNDDFNFNVDEIRSIKSMTNFTKND